MTLGIDASNICAGGGLRHLVELISHVDIKESGFSDFIVWASEYTLNQIPEKKWLEKKTHQFLNQSFVFRVIWQKFYLSKEAAKSCDLLFLPSGNTSSFHPYVSMCQNLLPFEPAEKKRYGISLTRLRLELLKWNQTHSFSKADGVIFLSDYSLEQVTNVCGPMASTQIIPHGVSALFDKKENHKKGLSIQLLYVSTVDMYKHQWNVVGAIYQLLDNGYDIELTLVGSAYPLAMKKLNRAIEERPEYMQKIKVVGNVVHSDLNAYYQHADMFVFASSCETFGMIVLEAMASGLPMVCSSKSSMKEVVGDAGIYFNPEQSDEIASTIKVLLDDEVYLRKLGEASIKQASYFSWSTTSQSTLQYLNSFVK